MIRRHPRYLVGFDAGELSRQYSDFLVLGTGIAGLFTALKAANHGTVTVLTKKKVADASTEYAQGGIAAAVGRGDSPELHYRDTLEAGHGLCDPGAVGVLVNDGPACVLELASLGARFERGESGLFALAQEGAHSRKRILHAHDATGAEVERALLTVVSRHANIRVLEDVFLVDILTGDDGTCYGTLCLDGRIKEPVLFLARATILATGGAGQLYQNTTNPLIATGDGMAAAYRAGATLKDMEFVQFHPTALHLPGSPGQPRFLVSEAVRGEGAVLVNRRGERFMPHHHPRAELAPRDVVSAAIFQEIHEGGPEEGHVWLDTGSIGSSFAERFPTIYRACREAGLNPPQDLLPVAPAAHYFMGGVATDTEGRTGVPALFACGEVACTGVHGANRLASNSLLEGLVFGGRIAATLAAGDGVLSAGELRAFRPMATANVPWQAAGGGGPVGGRDGGTATLDDIRARLQQTAWLHLGVVRCGESLRAALQEMDALEEQLNRRLALTAATTAACEVANLLTVGRLVGTAALARTESRGAQRRSDYPLRDDRHWLRHIIHQARSGATVQN